jgi:TRAP transporter TAXI family solute receptor
MKRFIGLLTLLSAIVVGCKQDGGSSAGKQQFVSIGTGGVTGVYYPTGGAIAQMVNKKKDVYGIKATYDATDGSVFNINAIMNGNLEFGIAQSDRQYQAYNGLAEWKGKGKQADLRSVFSIHSESITLIASEPSKVQTASNLKGKRVNLGNPGSGQLQNSRDVLAAYGLAENDIKAEQVKAVEAPGMVQDERIDAFFFTVGHPNGTIKEATSGRIKVRLIALDGAPAEALVKKFPYYAPSVISASFYPNALNKEDVPSIGVKATLVTSAKVSEEIVYAITKEVFENFEEFKALHPSYTGLTKESMLEGLSAPLHPGALKYYKEAGLDKAIKPELILK